MGKTVFLYGIDKDGKFSPYAEFPDRGYSSPFGFEGEQIYDYWKDKELDIPEDLRVAFATQWTTFAQVRWDLSRPEYDTPEIRNNLADGNVVKD
jgi:hypothetical protein